MIWSVIVKSLKEKKKKVQHHILVTTAQPGAFYICTKRKQPGGTEKRESPFPGHMKPNLLPLSLFRGCLLSGAIHESSTRYSVLGYRSFCSRIVVVPSVLSNPQNMNPNINPSISHWYEIITSFK